MFRPEHGCLKDASFKNFGDRDTWVFRKWNLEMIHHFVIRISCSPSNAKHLNLITMCLIQSTRVTRFNHVLSKHESHPATVHGATPGHEEI